MSIEEFHKMLLSRALGGEIKLILRDCSPPGKGRVSGIMFGGILPHRDQDASFVSVVHSSKIIVSSRAKSLCRCLFRSRL